MASPPPIFQGLVRGMLPFYLLTLLRARPLHGTHMMRSIAEMSGQTWRPSPGSVYPVLRRLERVGLVTGRWQRSRSAPKRVYRLTREGERALPEMKRALLKELRSARRIIDLHIAVLDHEVGEHHDGEP